MSTNRIPRNETRHHMVYTVNGLHPDRKYYFTVLSVSLLEEFLYETVECFTDTGKQYYCPYIHNVIMNCLTIFSTHFLEC